MLINMKEYTSVSSTKNVFLFNTQLRKLRVIFRSRILRMVYTLVKGTGR